VLSTPQPLKREAAGIHPERSVTVVYNWPTADGDDSTTARVITAWSEE